MATQKTYNYCGDLHQVLLERDKKHSQQHEWNCFSRKTILEQSSHVLKGQYRLQRVNDKKDETIFLYWSQ